MRAPSTEKVRCHSSLSSEFSGQDRPTRAIIHLNALDSNFKEARRRAEGRKVLAVVKAQAYGHGAVSISRRLMALGADMLGVALVEEGRELRSAGIDAPILVMGAVFPEQADAIADLGLTPVVYTAKVAEALSTAALKRGTVLPVHIKIDTGMGRIGLPIDVAARFIKDLNGLAGIRVQGLMTHFADADLVDKAFSGQQMDRFEALVKTLAEQGIEVPLRHAANSAALLDFHRALFTMVRPGLMLYGYDPLTNKAGTALQPVLSLLTRIAFLKTVPAGTTISYGRTFTTSRKSLIATIPIGYADGYSRTLSNRGEALVRGIRVPLVGRICMDMSMLDVTDVPDVSEQDEVVLLGQQQGQRITADQLAELTGTIAYEVLCGISSRVPRVYRS
jgi:alanine racemase